MSPDNNNDDSNDPFKKDEDGATVNPLYEGPEQPKKRRNRNKTDNKPTANQNAKLNKSLAYEINESSALSGITSTLSQSSHWTESGSASAVLSSIGTIGGILTAAVCLHTIGRIIYKGNFKKHDIARCSRRLCYLGLEAVYNILLIIPPTAAIAAPLMVGKNAIALLYKAKTIYSEFFNSKNFNNDHEIVKAVYINNNQNNNKNQISSLQIKSIDKYIINKAKTKYMINRYITNSIMPLASMVIGILLLTTPPTLAASAAILTTAMAIKAYTFCVEKFMINLKVEAFLSRAFKAFKNSIPRPSFIKSAKKEVESNIEVENDNTDIKTPSNK